MLTIALALTVATLQQPPPSSLHLIVARVEAPTPTRLLEIDSEVSRVDTKWSPGSVALMAVGFGGAGFFALGGLAIAVIASGLVGVFILTVGLATGGAFLLFGLGGLIWGATEANANQARLRQLQDERSRLLSRDDDPHLHHIGRSTLTTLATF